MARSDRKSPRASLMKRPRKGYELIDSEQRARESPDSWAHPPAEHLDKSSLDLMSRLARRTPSYPGSASGALSRTERKIKSNCESNRNF